MAIEYAGVEASFSQPDNLPLADSDTVRSLIYKTVTSGLLWHLNSWSAESGLATLQGVDLESQRLQLVDISEMDADGVQVRDMLAETSRAPFNECARNVRVDIYKATLPDGSRLTKDQPPIIINYLRAEDRAELTQRSAILIPKFGEFMARQLANRLIAGRLEMADWELQFILQGLKINDKVAAAADSSYSGNPYIGFEPDSTAVRAFASR